MRAIVQRLSEAKVTVGGRTVTAIGPGLLVLVGEPERAIDGPMRTISRGRSPNSEIDKKLTRLEAP